MNIHNYKRQFERNLERIQESKEISKENKKVIIDFKDYLLSEGIGIARINRFFYELMKYSKMFKKPFTEASKDDIRAIVAEVEQTDLSAETKKCYKIVLKKLYKFIKGIDEEGKYPKEVEERKKLAARFPKKPNEVFTNCWNCGIVVKLNNTERKSSPLRVLRIAECPKCRAYQIDRVDNTIKSLEFDGFLKNFR